MENESNISLGGAINLHTLAALTIFVGRKKTLRRSKCRWGEGMYLAGGGEVDRVEGPKYSRLYRKGIKKTQKKPMETSFVDE